MQQLTLLDRGNILHEISTDGVHAVFEDVGEATYDVTLDINSQKFLIRMTAAADQIEQFEIRVAKSFYEVTKDVILLLKRVVMQLWQKLLLRS
ncbi:MAG: hypothetical protein H6766_01155 [Candidatus Peribacteria bacterium]|nr:MAG: hypothetical protein H6766_01155 [Candidatus Peribacteria bacterium]